MIEQLLMQIAQRGDGSSARASARASEGKRVGVAALRRAAGSPLSHSSPSGFSLFPAQRARSHAPASLAALSEGLAAWEQAKQAHDRAGWPDAQAADRPAAFASFTSVHLAVGGLMWLERYSARKTACHIVNARGDVVAAVAPGGAMVAVRKMPHQAPIEWLSLEELPPSAMPWDSALISPHKSSTQKHTSTQMLLWYLGQAMPAAFEKIPPELLSSNMLLRKLPLIEPGALCLRHLYLFSIFSAGPIYLHSLLAMLGKPGMQAICADLASLYLTGCLVSSDSEGV